MKIMFLIRSLGYGGAERQLVILAQGLSQRGHEVSVAIFYPHGPFQRNLQLKGIAVHDLAKRHRWDIFSFMGKLIALVRTEKPDILHGYMVVPNVLTIVLKFLGFRQKMIWGVRSANMDLSQYHWTMETTFKLSCVAAHFADLIIVNSQCGRSYHQSQWYPGNKMVVIANGIDTDRFNINESKGTQVRKEWCIDSDQLLIGIVGRLDPMKNYEIFLAAAICLAEIRQDVCFVCIGDGPSSYKSKLHDIGANLEAQGKLIWAGARHDIEAVYNALNLFTNCSQTEGFPNVVGEAMACGIPCVVTDVGDSAKIVSAKGIIVDAGDEVNLVTAWERLLDNKVNNTRSKIRQRIVENYSIERLVENTENLLLKQLL